MACDESILGAIEELVKICKGVGASIDYTVPETDIEGMIVMNDLLGRVVCAIGDKPIDSSSIEDTMTFITAFTANLGKIIRCVV